MGMMVNQEKFDLIREVLSEAAMTEEERLLKTYRITPETKLPPMQPLFKMFDTPCFYRGELVAACGKAKSGKTLFLSILMAAGLTEKVLALERHTDSTDSAGNAVVQTTPPFLTQEGNGNPCGFCGWIRSRASRAHRTLLSIESSRL